MARRRKNINDIETNEEKENNEINILIYKYNDECYIERSPSCFNLIVHGKQSYYPTINQSFKALSHALLIDHFGRIPNEEKNNIKNVIRIIEEHDTMIKEMFKEY